jgi:GTP cyclohydrolase I
VKFSVADLQLLQFCERHFLLTVGEVKVAVDELVRSVQGRTLKYRDVRG